MYRIKIKATSRNSVGVTKLPKKNIREKPYLKKKISKNDRFILLWCTLTKI